MKNGENKNQNQESKFANPWRQSLPPLPQKPRFRTLKRAILILLAFLFLAVGIPRLYSEISFRWQYHDLIAQEKAFQRDYVKYSGKTPQEVYEKYVETLKKGDLETASKFYSPWEDMIRQKEYLHKLKAENKLQEYIDKFPNVADLEEHRGSDEEIRRLIRRYVLEKDRWVYDNYFKKEILQPAGVYRDFEMTFYFNPQYKVWKLHR
jgi:hypothetical protein